MRTARSLPILGSLLISGGVQRHHGQTAQANPFDGAGHRQLGGLAGTGCHA